MNGFLLASDLYVEITDQILELLIIPTMIAGLLAGLVLLINLFARKWLTAGQMGLLWALVLIRLALPYGYAPESSYSLTNLFVEFMEESTPAEPPRDAYAPEPWPMIDTNATTMADVPPMHQIQFPEPKPLKSVSPKHFWIILFPFSNGSCGSSRHSGSSEPSSFSRGCWSHIGGLLEK